MPSPLHRVFRSRISYGFKSEVVKLRKLIWQAQQRPAIGNGRLRAGPIFTPNPDSHTIGCQTTYFADLPSLDNGSCGTGLESLYSVLK